MAEVQVKDDGAKKKGKPKKMEIHIDFTPMVDMNMLLITFLCCVRHSVNRRRWRSVCHRRII